MKRIHVAAAVIRGEDGQILLAKRAEDQHQGGLWEFPGGKVEAGETVQTALARELEEELGCRLMSASLLGEFEAPAANEPGFTVRATTYLARVEGPIAPGGEIAELAWIDPARPGPEPLAPLLQTVLIALARASKRLD